MEEGQRAAADRPGRIFLRDAAVEAGVLEVVGKGGADVDAQGLGHLPLWEAAVEADSAQVLAHRSAGRRGSRNGVPILGG
jgi:hypothetical protein